MCCKNEAKIKKIEINTSATQGVVLISFSRIRKIRCFYKSISCFKVENKNFRAMTYNIVLISLRQLRKKYSFVTSIDRNFGFFVFILFIVTNYSRYLEQKLLLLKYRKYVYLKFREATIKDFKKPSKFLRKKCFLRSLKILIEFEN